MKQNVRNSLALSVLMLAALVSMQCTRKEEFKMAGTAVSERLSPRLHAGFAPMNGNAGTKTVTTPDGKVSWDPDDKLKAYVIPSDVTGDWEWYWYEYEYTTNETDCKADMFSPDGPLDVIAGNTYDWYVMSPYDSDVFDPVGGSGSSTEFSFDGQTQDCNNPTAHLTAVDVMTGTAEGIPAEQTPVVVLEHKCVLMKFTVFNNNTKPFTLSKIEFEAPEGVNIGGSYSIDFKSGGVLTPKKPSNKAVLTLSNPTSLSPGSSFDTYIIMPPFSIVAGRTFTIRAYSNAGTMEQTSHARGTTKNFEAGTLNTATFKSNLIDVTGVRLDTVSLYMRPGETYTLTPSITPDNAPNKNVVWLSDNTSVATVDDNGKVTAVSGGRADIIVRTEDSNRTDTCAVTVMTLELSKTELVIEEGTSETLIPILSPENSTKIIWRTDHPDIARVDRHGKVTAVKQGMAVVTATTEKLGIIAKCLVIVTAPNTVIIDGIPILMVHVEGGTFTRSDGTNSQEVTLTDYYIGKYEVTQGLWKKVMDGGNPSYFQKGDNYPVENVSWNDIQTFLSKLNEITGKTFVLPTEAQWEFAARGGNSHNDPYYKYSGSNTVGDVAWYSGNSSATHEVGGKMPNELGIYDMSGNVWEWCKDRYGNYSSNPQADPQGPSSGSSRVFRGGSWYSYAEYCRVANRNNISPDFRNNNSGFRLALVLP